MRKLFRPLLLVLCLCCMQNAAAQYDKAYFFWVGRGQLIDNQYREAIRTLNIVLAVDRKAHEGYFLRGVAKYNLDDLLGAEQDFSSAIEINPVYTMAYQYRAITRARLGNYDDALSDFHQAIELRPDIPGSYYSRGVTLLLSGQYEKAIGDFDRFIRFESKVSDAYINRGTCYLFLKDTVQAMENYDKAIRTNRENPDGYNRRGSVFMSRKMYEQALSDFNSAVACDTAYIPSLFNRALVYSEMNRPARSLEDWDRIIGIDSTSSVSYFNRAIVRAEVGDLNRALDDYNKVAFYSPDNVLVYFNRALLLTRLGELEAAEDDYSRAIELYPDFAAAYINRSNIKQLLRDSKGARQDRQTAERKIAQYRARLQDSTFSVSEYADTSQKFNRLLSFDASLNGKPASRISSQSGIASRLLPMFAFTLRCDSVRRTDELKTLTYTASTYSIDDFTGRIGDSLLTFGTSGSNIAADSLLAIDRRYADMAERGEDWRTLFLRGVSQTLIKQYTSAVNIFSRAIEQNPTNAFLYLSRATTQAEMIDFISSINGNYGRIAIESGPESRLHNNATRTYDYNEAIADLNKAAKLQPMLPHIYYNRAGLLALSGELPKAFEDYTKAIELDPTMAEAYFNRGIVQIMMKDTRKGCLDLSKAGELGIKEAYSILVRYYKPEH